MYRCIYVGRSVDNYKEILIILREVTLTLNNNTNNRDSSWSCIKFEPETCIEYWLVFLAKVSCLNHIFKILRGFLKKISFFIFFRKFSVNKIQ